MKVTIEQHVGRHLATGAEVTLPQYRVRVNGLHAGFVGWKTGKLSLSRRFSPIDRNEIERQVAELVQSKIMSRQAPEVPDGFYDSPEEEDDDLDA